jgi:hypothetical protein
VLLPPSLRCHHLCHHAANTATATALTTLPPLRFCCRCAAAKQLPLPLSPSFFSLRLVLSLHNFLADEKPILSHTCHSAQGLRRKKCNQTIIEPYIRADYNLEIPSQKWWALTKCLRLKNPQNLVLGKK